MGKRQVIISCVAVVVVVSLWLALTALLTHSAVSDLQAKEFHTAEQKASVAQILFWPINQSVGRFSADVRCIGASLSLLRETASIGDQLQQFAPLALAGDERAATFTPRLKSGITSLSQRLVEWMNTYKHSALAQRFIRDKVHSELIQSVLKANPEDIKASVLHFSAATDYLLTGQHRFIVVLQNSDELRATGGFMGSYASIELTDGVLNTLDIQDIYQPDGQFAGYVEPPPGAKEYLSAGNGLRLPDSNWSPDFPRSAQQVMQFFAFGKEHQVEGVVTINLHVAEQLLTLIGPVYLPDYGQTVTTENLSSLARADRSQFFPGSQQKRQFLQALFVQFKLQLTETLATKPQSIVDLLLSEAEHKQIQAFALSSELQQLFDQLDISGRMNTHGDSQYIFLVESNVGINKANRLVTRQVNVQLQPNTAQVDLQFTNQNPVTPLKDQRGDYINYQRLFVPASYRVHQLTVNGESLDHWDENFVTTASNESLKQIGFLIAVPAKASASASISLTHPEVPLTSITLQKQSGLANTPYHLQTPTKNWDILLEKDIRLSLE